ncbi:MAG: hypothetical protein LUG44_04920 [Clostridiales bacterium]|nr:hypothetical protein [Clostridiales bacterium]
MGKFLTILEVSRKQDYIFASKKLKENALRSEEIRYVTSSDFFMKAASEWYSKKEKLVYAGGGHTILEFPTQEKAVAFARQVTRTAMEHYRNMEIFVKTMPYDEHKTPGENLKALSAALEKKKALRRASFRRGSFGVEALDSESQLPKLADAKGRDKAEPFNPPDGWIYPVQMEELAGADNFVAVVHIDGNAMGKRVDALYDRYGKAEDWADCRASLRRFSEGIQQDFEAAFSEMVDTVIRCAPNLEAPNLPVRPVILAGDDVCFVTAGNIGLECARVFLEKLSAKSNQEDGKPYAACAGVALVHQKYPFHQAYDLAEELCSNAKRFGAELDTNGAVSAMDWHIEFGQLKDSLAELRKDYATEDGNRLELRPVVVLAPKGIDLSQTGGVRSYAAFRTMCQAMQGEYEKVARGKIKDLRTAFHQGKLESEFFLHDQQIWDLLYHGFEAQYRTKEARMAQYKELQESGGDLEKNAFVKIGDTERCLFFDAIEMIDHCCFFQGEAQLRKCRLTAEEGKKP